MLKPKIVEKFEFSTQFESLNSFLQFFSEQFSKLLFHRQLGRTTTELALKSLENSVEERNDEAPEFE